jgi:hypothetical protein
MISFRRAMNTSEATEAVMLRDVRPTRQERPRSPQSCADAWSGAAYVRLEAGDKA